MKFWNGSAWIPLDAADADTVDGKHASDFAPATHVGQGNSAHALATSSTHGFMSSSDKAKLDGIQAGAEVNQNTFSNILVGGITISADNKTDTLELVAGANITLTPDATNDKITIAVDYAQFAPASHVGSGGSAHALATTSAHGFMSSSDKAKLDGIASGAEVNQNAFTNVLVGGTTIAADSKTDTLELAAGIGINLTPDAVNDRVTIAVNATSAGGTEPNKIAMTNASGRVGDSEKVGGKTLSDLDNRYVQLHDQLRQKIDDVATHLAETETKFTNINLNIIDMAVELETLKGATLNGVTANVFIETFTNLNDINLMNGIYDSTNKRLVL